MQLSTGHLFDPSPLARNGEVTDPLATGRGARIERIVSLGQASPSGFWYDQERDEFVAVLSGAARVLIEGEPEARRLEPGDWIVLPARCRHRVEWTDPTRPTVWLAVHYDAAPG